MDMKTHEMNVDELDQVSCGGVADIVYRVMGSIGGAVVGLINAGLGALGGGGSGSGSSGGSIKSTGCEKFRRLAI